MISAAASAGAADAGLRPQGRRRGQGIPRRSGQDDLEPRGGPGPRLLPADLDCKFSAGLDDEEQPGRLARARVRPVDQRPAQSGGDRGRPGHASAPGLLRGAGRCAARLHRAEPADRIRDAQHACSGRALARRQHQPERLLHGVLHRGGGAGGRQGLARIPPRDDEQASQASRRAERGGREGRLGQAAAAGRASRHRPVHGLWQLFGRDRRGLGRRARARSRCTAWCWL